MKTAIIIPIRGINKSMSRLRGKLEDEDVNQIVKNLLLKTLDAISDLDYDTFILTSEEDLRIQLNSYNLQYVIDEGIDLNVALQQFVENQIYDRYLMIMPDLPGISKKNIEKVQHLMKLHQYVVCSTGDMGTACCALPKKYFTSELFGQESAAKIIELSEEEALPLSQIEINDLKYDLDTIQDLDYWKSREEYNLIYS